MDAQPGAHVRIKVTANLPSHPSQIQSWEEKKGGEEKGKQKTKKLRKETSYLLSDCL